MKQIKVQGLFISVLFILLTYLFSRGNFSWFFMLVFGLLLLIAFFKEEIRIFVWIILAFFGGNLIIFYADNFLEVFDLQPSSRVMVNQLLFFIPILTISYVIKAFKRKTKLNVSLDLSHLFMTIVLVTFVFLVIKDVKVTITLLIFAILHAFLQEILWRGLLLDPIIKITNGKLGILILSVAFGLNSTMLGFSPNTFFIYTFLGLLLSTLTIRTRNLLPAIFTHLLALILFFLNGVLPIPIL